MRIRERGEANIHVFFFSLFHLISETEEEKDDDGDNIMPLFSFLMLVWIICWVCGLIQGIRRNNAEEFFVLGDGRDDMK